jgi:hypothetical protein
MTIEQIGNLGIGWNFSGEIPQPDPEPLKMHPEKRKAMMKKHRSLFKILEHSCQTLDVEELSVVMESCTAILFSATMKAVGISMEDDNAKG